MENAVNRPPRMVTEGAEATCNHCGATIFKEIFHTDDQGSVNKIFSGNYRQSCDSSGNPTGPMIPFCFCRGGDNA